MGLYLRRSKCRRLHELMTAVSLALEDAQPLREGLDLALPSI